MCASNVIILGLFYSIILIVPCNKHCFIEQERHANSVFKEKIKNKRKTHWMCVSCLACTANMHSKHFLRKAYLKKN